MISGLNTSAVNSAYASNSAEKKGTTQNSGVNVSKQGDTSKIDSIKEAIDSGEYKINLQALSEKIAEELL